ncbi:MAG: bifunctional oligoribonuclease/PAP phosphatase NrnA [Chitinophagales bacterium]|jgi:phosphoesterase RecJ-like protein|nr:bifunctional oligoribonuclease/PAP phosphatase NrnA [Chitinophagales bacterium]
MKPISDLYSLLHQPQKVVITTHQKPDADAMGSSLALGHYLRKKGHEVSVISPTNWAGFVDWMPGTALVINYDQHQQKSKQLLTQADLLFCLDFNIFHRTKSMTEVLYSLSCKKVLIDHHQEPDVASFTFGVSDTSKSSTCEMIYDFIVGANDADLIDQDIAECIYAGVVGDTGSFRFASAHAGVHAMVADLKRRGLDHGKIHEGLYDNFLENRLRFIGHVLLHRMEIFYEHNTALIAIPKSDLVKFNIRTGDTEGLVNYPQSIQGIRFAALVIDRDEERKWSFRSKGQFDCNTFARTYFEGGGHYNAAGGRSSQSLEETVATFKTVLAKQESLTK